LESSKVQVARIHALNILRSLVRSSALRDKIQVCLADVFMAAIPACASRSFAVRNSAMTVLSSLQQRVFGVKRVRDEHDRQNGITARQFFVEHPRLYPYFLDKVRAAAQATEQQEMQDVRADVYAVLLLLSRLLPSPVEALGSAMPLSVFRSPVSQCTASRVMFTRKVAARAMVSLVPESDVATYLHSILSPLFGPLPTLPPQNATHGVLLQALHLLSNTRQEVARKHPEVFDWFQRCLWLCGAANPCFVTRCALLDCIAVLLDAAPLCASAEQLQQAMCVSLHADVVQTAATNAPWEPLFRERAVGLLLQLLARQPESSTTPFSPAAVLEDLLQSSDADHRLAAVRSLQGGEIRLVVLRV
jgi:hypothetical protein